jgi:transcriptional regulator with XRE-family HTH domain
MAEYPPNSALAGRIRALRRDAGFTQAAFAAHLEISQAAVSRWEQGRHMPDEAMLARIAALGGISPATLRYGEGRRVTSQPARRLTDHLASTIDHAIAGRHGDIAVALQVILDKCRADDAHYPGDRRGGGALPAGR